MSRNCKRVARAHLDRHLMEDCFYFVTSTCSKGASCPFRHCEAAKQATSICSAWLAGGSGCMDADCALRHSIFSIKMRSEIECYWQSHGGCKKTDCPFKHTNLTDNASITKTFKARGAALGPSAKPAAAYASVTLKSTPVTLSPAFVADTANADTSKEPSPMGHRTRKTPLDFEVKSLDEIMKEKRQKLQASPISLGATEKKVSSTITNKGKLASLTGPTEVTTSASSQVNTKVLDKPTNIPTAVARKATISNGEALVAEAKSSVTPSKEPPPKTQPVTGHTVSTASKATPLILDDDAIDEQFAEIERLINS